MDDEPQPGPEDLPYYTAAQEVFARHAAPLYRYIYSRVGHAALAEDLTSEVFVKALRWLDAGRSSESVRGWLYATARTSIADYWRSQGTLTLVPLDRVDQETANSAEERDDAAVRGARRKVRRLLERLPKRDRQVLALRYLRGLTAAEIGSLLGMRTDYVRVLQFRALRHAARVAMEEGSKGMETDKSLRDDGIQRALGAAAAAARVLNHPYIGTEHLLLGLLREGDGIAAVILDALEVRPEAVQATLEPGAEPFAAWACAFCGKGRAGVRRLIQGPGWVTRDAAGPAKQPLLICDECVARCAAIIAEAEAKGEDAASGA